MLETRSLVTPPSKQKGSELTSNLPKNFHLSSYTLFRLSFNIQITTQEFYRNYNFSYNRIEQLK